jgi:hypothetical protein
MREARTPAWKSVAMPRTSRMIEGGDHAYGLFAGCGELAQDAGEVVGGDANVGVVDDEEVVLRVGQHLDKVGDFAVRS